MSWLPEVLGGVFVVCDWLCHGRPRCLGAWVAFLVSMRGYVMAARGALVPGWLPEVPWCLGGVFSVCDWLCHIAHIASSIRGLTH